MASGPLCSAWFWNLVILCMDTLLVHSLLSGYLGHFQVYLNYQVALNHFVLIFVWTSFIPLGNGTVGQMTTVYLTLQSLRCFLE